MPLSAAERLLCDARFFRLNCLDDAANTKFYVPGSVLQATVDTTLPITYGLPGKVDLFYANSPAFRLDAGAEQKGTRPIAWFAGPEPLRSG